MRGAANGADPVFELVGDHPVEPPQSVLALIDGLARQSEEVSHRRLADHLDRVRDPLPAHEEVAAVAFDPRLFGDVVEERKHDAAQYLELLEDLVRIETLLVTER